jgi:hypothetical protein
MTEAREVEIMAAATAMGRTSLKGRRLVPTATPLGCSSIDKTFVDMIYDADHEIDDLVLCGG